MNVTMAFKVLWLIPEHCKLWPHVNPWQTPPSADDAIPESNHFCGQATRSCEEQPRHLHSTRSCTCAWANRIDTVHLQCPSYPSFSIIFEASIHSKQKNLRRLLRFSFSFSSSEDEGGLLLLELLASVALSRRSCSAASRARFSLASLASFAALAALASARRASWLRNQTRSKLKTLRFWNLWEFINYDEFLR